MRRAHVGNRAPVWHVAHNECAGTKDWEPRATRATRNNERRKPYGILFERHQDNG
jgi:hypothetical protein